jgi:hypothetical protein
MKVIILKRIKFSPVYLQSLWPQYSSHFVVDG